MARVTNIIPTPSHCAVDPSRIPDARGKDVFSISVVVSGVTGRVERGVINVATAN